MRRGANGVSKLKQVAGREYGRDFERLFLAVVHGAVDQGLYDPTANLMYSISDAQSEFFPSELPLEALDRGLSGFHAKNDHLLTKLAFVEERRRHSIAGRYIQA